MTLSYSNTVGLITLLGETCISLSGDLTLLKLLACAFSSVASSSLSYRNFERPSFGTWASENFTGLDGFDKISTKTPSCYVTTIFPDLFSLTSSLRFERERVIRLDGSAISTKNFTSGYKKDRTKKEGTKK